MRFIRVPRRPVEDVFSLMFHPPKMLRLCLLLLIGILLSGCETLSYYGQAVEGQLSIWWQREPIEQVLADPGTEDALKQQLALVLEIREFASAQLGLPDNNSYRYYSDLQRPHVVWNVFAAEEFSVSARRWCFPVAGCVSYRGYFSEQDAEDFARQLQQQQLDTYVGGVSAYSTLGWFDDPVLSTFIVYPEVRLAGLIFHELAHQQLYVAGDTTFNESFATAVELEGVRRWLASHGKPEQMQNYLQNQQLRQDFVQVVLGLRTALDALYQSGVPPEQMRQRKQALIATFIERDYADFKQRWGAVDRYDRWIAAGLNNAKLNTIASYHHWLGALQRLMVESGPDLAVFYQRAGSLAQLDTDERETRLEALAEQ